MNDLIPEKVVTTKELAESLGVTPRTIRNVVDELGLRKSISQVKIKGQLSYSFTETQAMAVKIALQNHSKVAKNGFNTLSIANNSNTEKTMTVEEVANIIGYDAEYLRKKCTELGYTRNGKKTFLNEQQVTHLKSVLVPRTSDMKIRGESSLTDLEILANVQKAMFDLQGLYDRKEAEYKAIIDQQNKQLEEQKPDVDFAKTVKTSSDVLKVSEVCKVLGLPFGDRTLYKILVTEGILQADHIPYQQYAKYFKVCESYHTDSNGNVHLDTTTKVYQTGVDFIRKRLVKMGYITPHLIFDTKVAVSDKTF